MKNKHSVAALSVQFLCLVALVVGFFYYHKRETPTPKPPPIDEDVTITVSYPDEAHRTLHVSVLSKREDMGRWWDKSVSDDDTDVTVNFKYVPDDLYGFQLNVSEGHPDMSWLCEGHGSNASLDPDAEIQITYRDHTYTTSDMKAVSDPSGFHRGCSVVLVLESSPLGDVDTQTVPSDLSAFFLDDEVPSANDIVRLREEIARCEVHAQCSVSRPRGVFMTAYGYLLQDEDRDGVREVAEILICDPSEIYICLI